MPRLEDMSTDEIGWEFADLCLVSDYGINRFNEAVEHNLLGPGRLSELYTEYWSRPDAESLDSYVECAIATAKENGFLGGGK